MEPLVIYLYAYTHTLFAFFLAIEDNLSDLMVHRGCKK